MSPETRITIEPIPLEQESTRPRREWRPFPLEVIPSAFRDYVTMSAAAKNCDESMVAAPLLAAIAGAVGGSRVVDTRNDWREPSSLWAVIVAETGSVKSSALRSGTAFTQERQEHLHEKHNAEKEEYERQRERWEGKKASWKDGGRAGDPPPKPETPRYVSVLESDTTIEALATTPELLTYT